MAIWQFAGLARHQSGTICQVSVSGGSKASANVLQDATWSKPYGSTARMSASAV